MSSNNQNTGGSTGPLNPSRRPQRLYQKVQVALAIAKQKLEDPQQTRLAEWLSQDEMENFQLAVREVIRKHLDDTFDSWPQREPHDYLPDVRYSIIRAINDGINEKGSMFDASIMNTEEDIWDPFVVGDFLLPPFYTN